MSEAKLREALNSALKRFDRINHLCDPECEGRCQDCPLSVIADLRAALALPQEAGKEPGSSDLPPPSASERGPDAPWEVEQWLTTIACHCTALADDPLTKTQHTILSCILWNLSYIRLAIAALPQEAGDGWLSMDSAPKDGTKVDLWVVPHDAFEVGNARRLTDAHFYPGRGGWCFFDRITGWRTLDRDSLTPTHWRPLPAPPARTAAPEAQARPTEEAEAMQEILREQLKRARLAPPEDAPAEVGERR